MWAEKRRQTRLVLLQDGTEDAVLSAGKEDARAGIWGTTGSEASCWCTQAWRKA